MTRLDHVQVPDHVVLFSLMSLEQLLRLGLAVLVAININHGLLGLCLPGLEDKPPWAFGEPSNHKEQQGRVHLHDRDRNPPGPLICLAEGVCHGQVDGKGHIQPENVHLKLLRQGLPAGIVAAQLAAVHGDHSVDSTNAQAHDDPSDPEHVNGVLPPTAQACEEHDCISQCGCGEAGEDGFLAAVVV